MKKPKLSEIVYKTIKEKIISNEFMPGQTLQEQDLAEMLDVSRTPVREALFQLAQDGWVDMNSQKSIVVQKVTLKDIDDIFELRALIEAYVLEEIFRNSLNRKLAGELDAVVQEMKGTLRDPGTFSLCDRRFHAAFVEILENGRLNRFWERITEEITRIGILGTKSSEAVLASVVDEHQKLAEALWNGNREEAALFLRQIRTKTYENLIKEIAVSQPPLAE
jgi:DNA-binding GntR family transcriptional regulator